MESQLMYTVPQWNPVLGVSVAALFARFAGTVALKLRTAQDVRDATSPMFEPAWRSWELLCQPAPAPAAAREGGDDATPNLHGGAGSNSSKRSRW